MRKITLLLTMVLFSNFMVHGQCDPSINVSPSICSDPNNNVYVIDPTADVEISIADASGVSVTGVVFNPVKFLYVTANQGTILPTAGTNPYSVPNPSTSVFFNGNPHSDPLNTYPLSGAQANAVYAFDATYTLPGCTEETVTITLVTGGFTFSDLCRLDVKTLADVGAEHEVLSDYNSLIWYSDAAGTTPVPAATTQISSEEVYYVDLGIAGCSPLPVNISSKSPKPEADANQKFCTATTWHDSGFPSKGGDTLNDLAICGANLTWYSDAAGTQVIPNPASEVLVPGETYYASQTINGCESELLEITPVEEECACFENTGLQNQDGAFNPDGYTFYSKNFSPISACQGMDYLTGTPQVPVSSIAEYDYFNNNQAVSFASAGQLIPWLEANGVYMPSTSPLGCSEKSIKLNDDASGSKTGTTMVKEFVAGEVLAFDFLFMMDDPPGHDPEDKPFITVRLFDDQGVLKQERCIIADTNNCIFYTIDSPVKPSGEPHLNPLVYTDWNCLKLNTIELQGQRASVEITTGDCDLSGHWGTTYLDNFYVGDDGPDVCDSAFGYMKIDPVASGSNDYKECSLVEPPVDPNCAPALPAINPNFPIQVNFDSVDPIGGFLTELNFDVIDNTGAVVFSPAPAAVQNPSPGAYYHSITQADLPSPYGVYTFESSGTYTMPNCGSTSYDYLVQAQSNGFKVCPTAGCPEAISLCDNSGSNPPPIDLEMASITSAVYDGANPSDLKLTYFTDEADAHNAAGPSEIPAGSLNTYPSPTVSTTIYIRLDVDYNALGITPIDDCYDIVALDILVGTSPTTPATVVDMEACDDGTGSASFNLEDRLDAIFGGLTQSDYTWEFYNDLNAAETQDSTQEIIDPTDFQSAGETIYVRVMSEDGCYTITQYEVIMNPLPAYNPPADYLLCDQGTQDGVTLFDFAVSTTQIEGTYTDLTITYYETSADAEGGLAGTQLNNPYENTTANSQTVYVRIEDDITGCYMIEPLLLEVTPAPTVTMPETYKLCDTNADGQEEFDLSTLDASINNSPNVTITYHVSQTAADAGTPVLPTSYTSATATLFARVEDNNPPGCYNTTMVDLQVNSAPDIPSSLPDLELCDDDTDGMMIFDLTQNEATILSNESDPSNFEVTYYSDLSNGTVITDETAYENTTPGTQTVFVLVENLTTACTTEIQFDIVVNPLPSYNTPEPLIICDDASANGTATFVLGNATAQITGNNPNLSVSYFPSEPTAQAGDPSDELANNYTNTTPYNEIIWIRIYNINTECFIVDSLDLQVDEAPQANAPQDFIYCDDDNDGVGEFILTDLDDEINNDPNITITYHQTQANANNNVLPLSSPFTNTVNGQQTIYVRVESPGVDCYSTVEAVLIVEDSPQPPLSADLDPLEECDDNNSENAVFDLTLMEDDILVNESIPTDFTISYYEDAAHTQEITVPTAYTSNGMSQTIYVVVEGLNGCTGETSFELIVNPLPDYQAPSALELCDDNNPGDEQEAFNLEDATIEITGGDNSLEVTYYETQADADADENPLSSPYTNTENNQTVYIRVEDNDTGCYVSQGFTLTLVVNPLPSPQVPIDPLEVCDTDNDGFAEFDLEAQIPIITNGELNVEITYHLTQANAEAGSNPLDTTQPYGVSSANNQTLYVRATNSLTGCYVVEVLVLEVVETPAIGSLEDLYVCDDDTADGFAIFDLTENTTNVIGGQNPTEVEVTYYETQADAEAGSNAIAVPQAYTNIVNPQRIYVRIENNATGCIDTFDSIDDNSFWIEVEENPSISDPSTLQICDDDYAVTPVSQSIFDLTIKEGEISGEEFAPSNYEFTYYASMTDYQAGTSITDPTNYENVENAQTIIVEVVNTDTEGMCADTVNLTIEVLPLPSPSETDLDTLRLEACDDDNDGIVTDGFDLTQSGQLISGGENVVLTYYTTENAAEDGDKIEPEYIPNPDSYTNDPSLNIINEDGLSVQIIYVRVDSNVNGNFCFVVVPFEIDVVPAPVLNNIEPFGYILCEDGDTGMVSIFLDDIAENVYDASPDFDTDPNTTSDTSVLVPLLDQTENEDLDINNYTITYHFTEDDAENGTGEVPNGYQVSDGEEFFIRIEYDDTGCYNTLAIGRVVVTVEERPSIEEVDIFEQLCSDEPGGDSVTIDLTQYNDQINPGAPADTQVVYYANMDDYMSGNAIDPSQLDAYATIENPQTIIAEVIDTVTLCESELFATIEIEIGVSPLVDISNYDGMVLCFDTNPNTPVIGGDYDPIVIESGVDATLHDFEWTQDGDILMETGPNLTVSEPGTYTLTVTDPLTGCTSTSSATFTSGNPPEFMVESTTLGFSGEHGLLISNVTGAGDYEFSVDNGPWVALGTDGTLTLDGLPGGVHEVRGRDRNGCGITLNEVFFIDYPKFFTPNEDGYNDRWNIQGVSNQLDAKIYIFDRYGKLLKQLSPNSEGWDGTFNGTAMPSNDYWFRVEYTDIDGTRKEFKANFTLKR